MGRGAGWRHPSPPGGPATSRTPPPAGAQRAEVLRARCARWAAGAVEWRTPRRRLRNSVRGRECGREREECCQTDPLRWLVPAPAKCRHDLPVEARSRWGGPGGSRRLQGGAREPVFSFFGPGGAKNGRGGAAPPVREGGPARRDLRRGRGARCRARGATPYNHDHAGGADLCLARRPAQCVRWPLVATPAAPPIRPLAVCGSQRCRRRRAPIFFFFALVAHAPAGYIRKHGQERARRGCTVLYCTYSIITLPWGSPTGHYLRGGATSRHPACQCIHAKLWGGQRLRVSSLDAEGGGRLPWRACCHPCGSALRCR